jgi:4-hydroxy-4-methyl-2-oxoglutarate aldolase
MIDCPPVSAIADVLALWGQGGWLTPPLRPIVASSTARIGRARTIAITVGSSGPGLTKIYDALSVDLTGCVVVVAGAEAVPGAVWGELLTLAAHQHGAVGVLVDGWVRDRIDMTVIGLPVYGRGEVVAGPQAVAHVHDLNIDVMIESTTVAADDVIVIDDSGCIRITGDHLDTVLDGARRYRDAESLVAQALRDGEPLSSAYRHKKRVVDELRR